MSSKRGADHVAGSMGSIASRLTFWYALLSVVLIATAGGVLYWVLAQRLHDEDDRLLAGKIAEIRAVLLLHPNDLSALREEVQHESDTLPGIFIRVKNVQGEVIAESPVSGKVFDEGGPLATGILGDGTAQNLVARDGEKYRVLSGGFELGTRYTVDAALRLTKEDRFLADYRRILILSLAAALASALAAGYLIARRGLQPVSRLAAIVDELGPDQLHRRIGDGAWPAEVKPLAQNFDRLLSRLEASFGRISRFSADIAHELRTPLHILRGEAELALTKGRSMVDYRACIESAADEYERLSRMVDALLFLARSEQPDAHIDRQVLDIRREVTAVFDFYQAMADEQGVSLTLHGEGTVMADSSLLRRALGNLVANALQHTPSGGQVTVEVQAQPDHSVAIIVRDTGHGIAAADLPHVLDRFYRADKARHRRKQGTGLGLAIVQSIMQLHGGTVSIQSQIDQGTSVTLTFPASTAIYGFVRATDQ